MKMSRQSRNYAETVGYAVAFGFSMTTCDVFQQPTTSGFVHGVRGLTECQLDLKHIFTTDSFRQWTRMMRQAEDLAHKRDHDPCQYGVCIVRLGDKFIMKVARHEYLLEKALGNAEDETTESWVTDINNVDEPIYLESYGLVPGTS